jgi:DNA processing protein
VSTSPPESAGTDIEAIRREDPRFPALLARASRATRILYVAGGADRLQRLLREPTVAIIGSRAASDYGMEMAHGLARGLAASGVTVVSGLADGIAAAAHAGAVEIAGPTVTVMPGGLDVCYPASARALYRRVRRVGCAISEQPRGTKVSRWRLVARTRLIVGLAHMVIVVEGDDGPGALAPARVAEATGKIVAAVPGRATSPLARGPHALLMNGAPLVRNAQDALDALYGVGAKSAPALGVTPEARLQAVLDQVGAGRDTLAKLTADGTEPAETLLALAELELAGALVRGDGGRYLVRV